MSELLWFLEGSDDERRLAEIRFNKNRDQLKDLDKYSTIWTDNADNQGKQLGYENTDTKNSLAQFMECNGETGQGETNWKISLIILKMTPMAEGIFISMECRRD